MSTLASPIGQAVETAINVDPKMDRVKAEGWNCDVSWFMLHLCDYFVEGKGIGYGGSVGFGCQGT